MTLLLIHIRCSHEVFSLVCFHPHLSQLAAVAKGEGIGKLGSLFKGVYSTWDTSTVPRDMGLLIWVSVWGTGFALMPGVA